MNKNELKNIAEGLIETFNVAGQEAIDLYNKGLKIEIKPDNSPVSNGDLKCNELITKRILELTPNIPIVSEETVDLKIKNKNKIFWLIDPIDGTKEYIAGKEEYTLNAALIINKVSCVGLVGAPRKKQLFYSYGAGESYLVENNKKIKNNCSKKTPQNEIIALCSSAHPSEEIMKE
jgi:3'(2'), 5'-bisphosphate nucleotidase